VAVALTHSNTSKDSSPEQVVAGRSTDVIELLHPKQRLFLEKHNCAGAWPMGGDCHNDIRNTKQLASRRKLMWLMERMKHRPKGARVMRDVCPNSECANCAVTRAAVMFALDFVRCLIREKT